MPGRLGLATGLDVGVCVALLRGINVGRAKRIAMADLRDLVEGLGHGNVRTLLSSGNVVFECPRPNVKVLSKRLQAAIAERCGFVAAVTVLTGAELRQIVAENPFRTIPDPSRFLVAFVADSRALTPLRELAVESWEPDAIEVTSRAAYLWCSTGILHGKLMTAFSRKAKATVTARNWSTALKLLVMVDGR